MNPPLQHWLDALGACDGNQACIGLELAQADRWPVAMSEWPARYVERLVIRLDQLTPDHVQMLARARNLHARKIALWIDQPSEQDLSSMLGLGFKILAGPPEVGCYGYDIVSYNHTRDWNNPRYWANPERWGKDYW